MKTNCWLVLVGAIAASGMATAEVGDGTGPTHDKEPTLAATVDSAIDRDRMALAPGVDGGALPSLLIEAEDRIEIRFDRPQIALDLDPRSAPGLDWDESWDQIDLFPAAVGHSALESSTALGRPWLHRLASGQVVVFHPQADSAEHWRLSVVNSRGTTVRVFSGKGTPPREIVWDGRCSDGAPAWPGLVYTHTLETTDRAGNQRTYVGQGFELPPYRLMENHGLQLVLAGEHLGHDPESLVAEIASWLNQMSDPERPIRIHATARTRRQAGRLAEHVQALLQERVLGPGSRWETVIDDVPDAPDQGLLEIAVR